MTNEWTIEKMREQSDDFIHQVIAGDKPQSVRRQLGETVRQERLIGKSIQPAKPTTKGANKGNLIAMWGILVAVVIGLLLYILSK